MIHRGNAVGYRRTWHWSRSSPSCCCRAARRRSRAFRRPLTPFPAGAPGRAHRLGPACRRRAAACRHQAYRSLRRPGVPRLVRARGAAARLQRHVADAGDPRRPHPVRRPGAGANTYRPAPPAHGGQRRALSHLVGRHAPGGRPDRHRLPAHHRRADPGGHRTRHLRGAGLPSGQLLPPPGAAWPRRRCAGPG